MLLVARTDGQPAADAPPVGEPAAVVAIEERVRAERRATLDYFAAQDVTVKVMSGDDPRTVGAVAQRVGAARRPTSPFDARHLPDDPDELADLRRGDRRVRPGRTRSRSRRWCAPCRAAGTPCR